MMELMSPAGSKESFISALDNGADAVYLGLKIFNARKPAKNFTVAELKRAKEYAASLGKKIYLTLNIDLKSNELEEASQILSYCSEIKIDGVIVKDPALLSIINIFFKDKLEIHFSTQNAVESSFAFVFAQKNNAKRVVLARELTLDEIKEVAKNKGAEIEIFSEGSMCFSISGRCFMSSYVGGKGGNRGQCQAPCRLNWRNGEKEFPFFSMKDLSLISHLKELERVGVKALKIEGRLKSPSWVAEITSIYRKALDAPDNEEQIEVLKENLKKYSARERNTGHLFFHDNLVGLNKEFDNYKKEASFKSDKLSKIFNNSYKIDINSEDDKIKTKITVNDNKESFLSKMPSVPKKARLINFKEVDNILTENLKDYDVEINNLLDFEASSAFLNGFVDEVVKQFNNLINEEEKLPNLDKEIVDF
ncbi:MAG TPA: peptidase U32 family protein, partial [Spirochaetota bacterium]|nr:peptidase U32 family protein [Spirochaetota bacterium]